MKLERLPRRVAVVVAGVSTGVVVAVGTAALPAAAQAAPAKGAVALDQWHEHGATVDHHWLL